MVHRHSLCGSTHIRVLEMGTQRRRNCFLRIFALQSTHPHRGEFMHHATNCFEAIPDKIIRMISEQLTRTRAESVEANSDRWAYCRVRPVCTDVLVGHYAGTLSFVGHGDDIVAHRGSVYPKKHRILIRSAHLQPDIPECQFCNLCEWISTS